ncbi:PucR family transcriptional regulator [Nocardia rhizosphaerihabitans]|uniref:PucR family transcriptional regulator n=1 Tax=Nocardia rhizosphaerihabitans TaxID=1691570 RepID=UPI003671C473
MALTVADIVALPVVQRGEPEVLCEKGFDGLVRWVHVSDLDDLSGLLSGGELVLTTGPALWRHPRRYLSGLAAAGAIGVIVELGETGAPPSPIGDIAAELSLALVVLHRVIRFVEVTELVHRSIVAEQYEQVVFARSTHEIFTDLSMRRATPTEIVDAASGLLHAPVVLEDLAHQAVAVSAAGRPVAELLRDWERRSRLHATDADATQEWLVRPVGHTGEEWGRLIALSTATSASSTLVIERAAQALAMLRMAEKSRIDLEHQAQAGLIDDVLRERIRTEDEAAARAFALGLRPAAQYLSATVRAGDWPADTDPVAAQRRSTRLLDAVARAVKASGHTGLFSLRSPGEIGMVLALQPAPDRQAETVLNALGNALRRATRQACDTVPVALGVAGPTQEIIEAIRRIGESAHVAEVAVAMPEGSRSFFRIADVRLRGLLTLLRGDPRVQRFAEAELRELIVHDLKSGDGSLDVLRGYLELAGNKSALAARLHLSRPTLYAKLARIERILNVDLADGESATSLHVALLVLEAQAAPADFH